jgi:transcriptional regulator with XRE-family HTH domain
MMRDHDEPTTATTSVNPGQPGNRAAGRLLADLRAARGLSQPALARRAGLSERTVRYAEKGACLSRATITRLSAALQAPTSSQDALLMVNGYTPTEPTWRRMLDVARASQR